MRLGSIGGACWLLRRSVNMNNKQTTGASILGNIWKGDADENWVPMGVVQDVEVPKVP